MIPLQNILSTEEFLVWISCFGQELIQTLNEFWIKFLSSIFKKKKNRICGLINPKNMP